MKIKSISAQQVYRLKVSGRPVPSQPGLDEVITDGRGNWAVDFGDEWSWGYGGCEGFKKLESSFQERLAEQSSDEPRKEIPGLPSVDDEIWDKVRPFFVPHPDRDLPRASRRRDSTKLYFEEGEDSATRLELQIAVRRLYEQVTVEVLFGISLPWLPMSGGVYIEAGGDDVDLDFFEDPLKSWADQIYPRIQDCYNSALEEAQSVIMALLSDEGSRRLVKELSPFRP